MIWNVVMQIWCRCDFPSWLDIWLWIQCYKEFDIFIELGEIYCIATFCEVKVLSIYETEAHVGWEYLL